MNTSRKAMGWLISFSIVNLMLGCLLCKKLKKFNESCSLNLEFNESSSFKNVVIFIQTILSLCSQEKLKKVIFEVISINTFRYQIMVEAKYNCTGDKYVWKCNRAV